MYTRVLLAFSLNGTVYKMIDSTLQIHLVNLFTVAGVMLYKIKFNADGIVISDTVFFITVQKYCKQ